MQLDIIDKPEYISPTAFKVWSVCQYKYYLKYLTGERPLQSQTEAMAIGSLFDALIKNKLAKDLKWYNANTDLHLEKLLKNVDADKHILLPNAKMLLDFYISSGAYGELLKENIAALEYDELKLVKSNKYHTAFPIYGKPDCKLNNGILDFKVNGYGSKSGQSPKQGYARAFDKKGYCGPHEKYGISMPEIDIDWATQLTIYSWLDQDNELLELKDITVAIEQIAIRGTTIKVASFRATVPVDFQQKLYDNLKTMWEGIINGVIEDPKPNTDRCFQYRQPCEVREKCNAFQKAFNDDEFNKMLGLKT